MSTDREHPVNVVRHSSHDPHENTLKNTQTPAQNIQKEDEHPKKHPYPFVKPKTDADALPTEVLLDELVPSAEVSRPARMPAGDMAIPGTVTPGVTVVDPLPDPNVTQFLAPGADLRTKLGHHRDGNV